jgi:hypothetical protein
VGDEQRGREEADRRKRSGVRVRERIGDGTDVRDVPGEEAPDDEPRDDGCEIGRAGR